MTVQVLLQARTPEIAELVDQCARDMLPFSGPNSLCKVHAMGYKTTSLYEMVMARENEIASTGKTLE